MRLDGELLTVYQTQWLHHDEGKKKSKTTVVNMACIREITSTRNRSPIRRLSIEQEE
jgi:hypothetical protein